MVALAIAQLAIESLVVWLVLGLASAIGFVLAALDLRRSR